MSNAQAEQMALMPADAHDPQNDRPTIDTPESFNAHFADALAWEAARYGSDPTGMNENY